MTPTGHEFLENTLPSMAAAFKIGADVVELDVHRTVDDRFAVFHDWTLDCRTEGSGVTREQALEELQKLDIGFGYTADGGKTFPFRGQGVGLMPSLDQVMTTFPERAFFIDVKGNSKTDGSLLAERLAPLVASREGEVIVFGTPRVVKAFRDRLPELRTITRPRLKRCLKRYLALGWSGYVPSECRRTVLLVPANGARFLWGWPNRLLRRMDQVGTSVVLIGDYAGETYSNGFDDPARLTGLPSDYAGGIWTNRVELIAPELRRLQAAK